MTRKEVRQEFNNIDINIEDDNEEIIELLKLICLLLAKDGD